MEAFNNNLVYTMSIFQKYKLELESAFETKLAPVRRRYCI